MHLHVFVVGNGGWRSVVTPDRNDIVNDYPRVVAARKNAIYVLCSDVSDVVERSARLFVIQTPTIKQVKLRNGRVSSDLISDAQE